MQSNVKRISISVTLMRKMQIFQQGLALGYIGRPMAILGFFQ
jgi:hypothetical protein